MNEELKKLISIFPLKAKHNSLGEIEIIGIRIKSLSNNNLMFLTIVDDEMMGGYDYQTEILF